MTFRLLLTLNYYNITYFKQAANTNLVQVRTGTEEKGREQKRKQEQLQLIRISTYHVTASPSAKMVETKPIQFLSFLRPWIKEKWRIPQTVSRLSILCQSVGELLSSLDVVTETVLHYVLPLQCILPCFIKWSTVHLILHKTSYKWTEESHLDLNLLK